MAAKKKTAKKKTTIVKRFLLLEYGCTGDTRSVKSIANSCADYTYGPYVSIDEAKAAAKDKISPGNIASIVEIHTVGIEPAYATLTWDAPVA